MLEPEEFLAEAQSLAVGEKKKVRHLCGDASLVVYNNVDSWSAWCWRCHMRGWVPKPEANMRERLERKRQQEQIDNALRSTVQAPQPECHDFGAWPVAARVWLWKAGLTPTLVRQLGAYYHHGSDRVVIPVRDSDGKVVFWQARNPTYPQDGRPKYISAAVRRDSVHAVYPSDGLLRVGAAHPLVFTEDLLSAFKVGASHRGVGYAVMGTSLGVHTTAALARAGIPSVLTWFDADGAGEAARKQVRKQLDYVGCVVEHLVTPLDPKAYSLREIGERIDEQYRPQHVADLPDAQALPAAAQDVEREVRGP